MFRYKKAYDTLASLTKENGSFKTAVFIVENTYHNDTLFYYDYNARINGITTLLKMFNRNSKASAVVNYDSGNYLNNYSLFSIFKDSVIIIDNSKKYVHIPFKYNFNDPQGYKDWNNMFVTTLLKTNNGNCHSLTYLYKIIANELGAKCWLALAPNHIYIRNYSRKIGWYNTELTSGTFPTDAWIATSSYVSADAIRSGVYMDTLSNQQSIALCVLDLAKGYEFQTHNYYDGFILKCCDLVLQYHPVNPMALLLKAETLKKVYFKQFEDKNAAAPATYAEMEKVYIMLAKLHYREMPEKMYQQWLASLTKEKEKYTNKKVHPITKASKTSVKK
jgi:hypothetical protein